MKKSKATEALRVATDIAAIKAALYKRGYRLRKQPKQPVWKVIIAPDHFYKLTYQPAPISAWVLHPQNNDTRRQAIALLPRSPLSLAQRLTFVVTLTHRTSYPLVLQVIRPRNSPTFP